MRRFAVPGPPTMVHHTSEAAGERRPIPLEQVTAQLIERNLDDQSRSLGSMRGGASQSCKQADDALTHERALPWLGPGLSIVALDRRVVCGEVANGSVSRPGAPHSSVRRA